MGGHSHRSYFLVVCLNPTLQNTFTFPKVELAQVNRTTSHRLDIAGKGVNTTRILQQLGERAIHLTHIGGRHKSTFLDLVAADGLDVRYVEADIVIRHCHTLLDRSAGSTTEIVEPGHPVPSETEEQVLRCFGDLLRDAHSVILGGSKAPGYTNNLFPHMVRDAKLAGKQVLLDIRGDDLLGSIPYSPDVVKINVAEFGQTFLKGVALPEDVDMGQIPEMLFTRMLNLREREGVSVVLTNGSKPVLYVGENEVGDSMVQSAEPEQVAPVNAIGCGDAVTAGVAAALRRGDSLPDAVRLGMECARKNVMLTKPGSIVAD